MDCRATPYTLLLLIFTGFAVAQYAPPSLEAPPSPVISVGSELASKNHKSLSAAIKAAGLADLLDSDGPFTIFAPSEAAIEEWAGDRLPALLIAENKKELRAMLTYHIIAGELTASRILRAMCSGGGTTTLTTVQGNEILANMEGTDIVLTDCSGNTARITRADANRQNGVIHIIDKVISPR